MKTYAVLLCVILLASGSLFVSDLYASELAPREKAVSLEGGIQGIVLEPEPDSPLPAVLMLHGFGRLKPPADVIIDDLVERVQLKKCTRSKTSCYLSHG